MLHFPSQMYQQSAFSGKGEQWLGVRTQNPDEAQPAMSFQLLTFLGIRSQDLSKCSSSKLWGKHNPL